MAFLVAVFLICVFGYGYYNNVRQLIVAEKTTELTTIAKLKADQITEWRKERIGDATVIHHNIMLADRLQAYLAGLAPKTVPDELKVWLESLRSSYGYHSAALYKTDGTLLVSATEPTNPADFIPRQIIEKIVLKPVVTLNYFQRDENAGPIHLNLMVPVGHTIGKQFKTIAVLVLDIDPHQFLYPLIQNWPTKSASAETLLVKRSGDEVLFLNELRHRSGTALNLRIPLTDSSMPAVRAALGQEGVFESKDYRNVGVLSVTRKIPGSLWAIVAKVDLSEIYEPIKTRARWVLIFSSMLILGAGLGIYHLWSRQFVKVTLESEEKYRAVADNTYDWEYWNGVDGSIIYCSPSCERITGYTADDFLQDPELLIRIIHPDDRDTFKHHLDFDSNYLAPADCQSMDFRIHTRSGKECWISHVCQEIFDANGASLGRRACNHDITERKQAEETLARSRAELKAIYDTAPVMISLVDADKRILYANRAFTTFTGISEDDLKGGHACGVFDCANALDDPRGCGYGTNCRNCGLIQAIEDTFQTGAMHQQEEFGFTFVRHGHHQNFTFLGSTVLLDSGDRNCLLLTLQDITEHTHMEQLKLREDDLRESERLLREVQSIANLGNYVLNISTGLWTSSDVFDSLFGIDEAYEHSVEGWAALIHPDERAAMTEYFMDEVLGQGKAFDKTYRIIRHDNRVERWVHGLGKLEFDLQGRPLKMIGTIQDITELKLAENTI
jgi:PAS domain S-box-containing protein